MTRRKILLSLFLLLPLLAAAYWWWRPAEVTVVTLATQDVVRTVVSSGRVEASRQSRLGATIGGRVVATPVAKGQAVTAGTVLLQLEPEELLAQLQQTRAQLEDAGQQQADAERQLQRQLALFRQGFVSQAALDAQQRGRDQARLRVAQLQAQLAQYQARLAQAQIRAPSDGVLLAREVEVGDLLTAGSARLSFAAAGPKHVLLDVDERQLAQLASGQPALIAADAFPARRVAGKVGRIAAQVDNDRGTLEVEVLLDGDAGFLLPGMTVSAEIETARLRQVLLLPAQAVKRGQVALVQEGRLQLRPVRASAVVDGKVQILQGLRAGMAVVTPFPLLAPGSRVRIVEAAP